MNEEQLRKRFEAWCIQTDKSITGTKSINERYPEGTMFAGHYKLTQQEMAWQAVKSMRLKLPEYYDYKNQPRPHRPSDYSRGWNECLATIEIMNSE